MSDHGGLRAVRVACPERHQDWLVPIAVRARRIGPRTSISQDTGCYQQHTDTRSQISPHLLDLTMSAHPVDLVVERQIQFRLPDQLILTAPLHAVRLGQETFHDSKILL